MRASAYLAGSLLLALLAVVPGEAANAGVTVSNFAFTPAATSLVAGDVVTWTWSSGTHNVVEATTSEVWCSTRSSGACARAFPAAGTYSYKCGIHPSMTGSVTVSAATSPASVAIASPADGANVPAAFTVSGTASHGSGIARVDVQLDDRTFVAASGTTSWSATFTGVADGAHRITAVATPASGDSGVASIAVAVGAVKAVAAFTSPAAGATVGGVVALAGTATHATSAITAVAWRVDGGAWQTATLGGSGASVTWSASWDSAAAANGGHTLAVQAFTSDPSEASNVATRGVTVSNAPTIDLRVTSLTATTGHAASGPRLTVAVQNAGNTGASGARLLFQYEYHGTWRTIAQTVVTVGAGQSIAATVTWSSAIHVGEFPVRATIDATNLFAETDETNNARSATAAFYTAEAPGVVLTDP